MTLRTLVYLVSAVVVVGGHEQRDVRTHDRQLVLDVLLLEPPTTTATRVWLRIVNNAQEPQILCRPSWGYTWIPDDPQSEAVVEERASIHGCGDERHDSLWLLLPGHSRFDSYEVTAPGGVGASLEVDVEIERRRESTAAVPERIRLTWKGRAADALAAGRALMK